MGTRAPALAMTGESREFSQQCLCFYGTLRRLAGLGEGTFVSDVVRQQDGNVLSHFLGNL